MEADYIRMTNSLECREFVLVQTPCVLLAGFCPEVVFALVHLPCKF
jgi:hypothetical protein